jgi:RimJ/RimL family protein N-acetyltransferase
MRGEVMLELENSRDIAQQWQIAPPFASLQRVKDITIRKAEISDAGRILEMHQRLSQESVYSRYLYSYTPSLEDMRDVCSLESDAGYVLIATVEEPEEKVVGIAYYCFEPQDPTTAEPAILVEDEYQGCGLGKQLLKELCQSAARLGVTEFICHTDLSNHRVHRMIERSGMRFESKYDQGMKKIHVWLDPHPVERVSA